jgi:large subunit ribosomal protein L4
VPGVRLLTVGQLNTYDVLASEHVVFTQAALEQLTGREAAPAKADAPAAKKDAPAAKKDAPAAKKDAPAAEKDAAPAEKDAAPVKKTAEKEDEQ